MSVITPLNLSLGASRFATTPQELGLENGRSHQPLVPLVSPIPLRTRVADNTDTPVAVTRDRQSPAFLLLPLLSHQQLLPLSALKPSGKTHAFPLLPLLSHLQSPDPTPHPRQRVLRLGLRAARITQTCQGRSTSYVCSDSLSRACGGMRSPHGRSQSTQIFARGIEMGSRLLLRRPGSKVLLLVSFSTPSSMRIGSLS